LGARVGVVAKVGSDDAGALVRAALTRLQVDTQWLGTVAGGRTTVWREVPGRPGSRGVDRGADLSLRLDEVPSARDAPAHLTVVSGYSLSVEPARSAAIGALQSGKARGGKPALQLDAELLWWTNPRMTRKVLEPALGAAHSIALTAADARTLFGPRTTMREAVRELISLGPHLVLLIEDDGSVLLQEGGRAHLLASQKGTVGDRYAGPAAFWVALARGMPPRRAATLAQRHALRSGQGGAHAPIRRHPL
jgi:sugar/nucleoside kinase (ribokinase family)